MEDDEVPGYEPLLNGDERAGFDARSSVQEWTATRDDFSKRFADALKRVDAAKRAAESEDFAALTVKEWAE